jgi:hypothetical protein
MIPRVILIFVLAIGAVADGAWAQARAPLEAAAQIATARVGELDSTDVGIGGRVTWHPWDVIGVEGELTFYPGDIPDRTPVSRSRLEGLFGVTAGPRLGRWRPFARIRPGFLRIAAAPEPVACILIFPPPLSCALAAGDTRAAVDLGGGVEVFTSGTTFVRVDVGDRMISYQGPAIDRRGRVHDDQFIGHDVRVAIGAGWRF